MMHVIPRSWTATGAAVVFAGTIVTAAPVVTPLPSAPAVVSAPVDLAVLPSWLQWVNNGTTVLSAQIAAIAGGLQNELDNPVPIVSAILRNQVFNIQDVGGALITAAQVLTTGLVGVPQLLLNGFFDIVANPLNIPAVLTGLVTTVINTVNAAITPVSAAVTSLVSATVSRAVGVFTVTTANLGAIGAAVLNVPVAIANAIGAAALGVVGSLATLNPLNVIGAVGDAVVSVEAAAFNSAAGVATAVGNLRQAIRAAVSYPLPAAAVHVAAQSVSVKSTAAAPKTPRARTASPATASRVKSAAGVRHNRS